MLMELETAGDPVVVAELQRIVDREALLTNGTDAVDQLTDSTPPSRTCRATTDCGWSAW
jgi:hypothetical protein